MVYLACGSLALSGCVTNGGGTGLSIGPKLSSLIGINPTVSTSEVKPRLDIIIPVFDPGIEPTETKHVSDSLVDSEGRDNQEAGTAALAVVWPELRRAEANRFAVKLKAAIEATGAFGAVRVTPDSNATGDLYVMGRITESDGEDVEIELRVVDISGDQWFEKSFDHTVEEKFHDNLRNKGKDPYDPVFQEAAQYLADQLKSHSASELSDLSKLADLRFGASFSEQAFAKHLRFSGDRVALTSLPSDEDPMLKRTRAIRVRDQLFVDGLQENYSVFSDKMQDAYAVWQKQSLTEIVAERDAKMEAAGQAAVGVLLIGAAILAAAAGGNSNNYGTQNAAAAGAIYAGVAGAVVLGKSFQTSKEAKVHRDALQELGETIEIDLAPQVVEFEKETVKLTGNAKEQFAQWRDFLKKVYEHESTPNKKL